MYEEDDNPVALFEGWWAAFIVVVVVGVAAAAIASALFLAWAAFSG